MWLKSVSHSHHTVIFDVSQIASALQAIASGHLQATNCTNLAILWGCLSRLMNKKNSSDTEQMVKTNEFPEVKLVVRVLAGGTEKCAAAAYQSKSSLPEGQAANERDAVEWRWSVTCDYKSPLDGGLLTDRWTLAGWMDILCVFFLPAFTWGCPCWWHTWCGCKCSCTFHELLCSPLRRRPKRGKKKNSPISTVAASNQYLDTVFQCFMCRAGSDIETDR